MEAQRTLPPATLAEILVDVPGRGRCQPWKGSDYAIAADGSILL